MFTPQCFVAEVQLLRRLKNEEALLQKNKKVGSSDMVKSARAGPRALGPTSGPSKIRRSTNDAPSLSALSINPASTSSSSSSSNRSVLSESMPHSISFSSFCGTCSLQALFTAFRLCTGTTMYTLLELPGGHMSCEVSRSHP